MIEVEQISSENDNVKYRFTVEDNGIAMNNAYTDHIFKPFMKESNQCQSIYAGTGLGMTITKNWLMQLAEQLMFSVKKTKVPVSLLCYFLDFQI